MKKIILSLSILLSFLALNNNEIVFAEENITGYQGIYETVSAEDIIDKIIEQMNTNHPDLTDVERALYLHDWITTHINYDNQYPHGNFYLTLLHKETECVGFAKLYKYLLNKVNISCREIISESASHAWNLITLDNNNYYMDCSGDSAGYHYTHNIDRRQFLNSRDKFDDSFDQVLLLDWGYMDFTSQEEANINVYETVETSTQYDDYDWSSYSFTFDDSIFETNYPKGTTIVSLNGFTAGATDNKVILFGPENQPTVSLNETEKAGYYIHDIEADGTSVIYHTWLKENGSEATQLTHRIDWSDYFTGSCGNNVTWSYLDGTLSISGNGTMDDYYASFSNPAWNDFSSLITRINIDENVTSITLQPYEENLTKIYFGGTKAQWNSKAVYKDSSYFNNKTFLFGKHDVSFLSKNGVVYCTQTVDDNANAVTVDAPEITGYSFDGWYLDETCNTPFDFNAAVTQDYTLYPKYTKSTVTVSFNSNGGSAVNKIQVPGRTVISKPDDPQRNGFTFEGWYTDLTFNTAFDFSKPVNEDTILYAKWNAAQSRFTVLFMLNNATYDFRYVNNGELLAKPTDPQRNGFVFKGWFTDEALTVPYDFTKPVENDFQLYGKMVRSVTVTFNPNNNQASTTVTIGQGDTVTKPSDPQKTGFTFEGWYADSSLTNRFDFNSKIDSNTNLYAKWSENQTPVPNPAPTPTPTPEEEEKKEEPTGTFVIGQSVNVKELFFQDVTGIAKYRTVLNETETNASKYATVTAKGILSVKKAGKVKIIPMKKTGKTFADIENVSAVITILPCPKLKFEKPLTYVGQTINAYDYLSDNWKDYGLKAVEFTSSKPLVASINDDGKIVVEKAGSTTITVFFSKKNDKNCTNTIKRTAVLTIKVPAFAKTEYKLQTGQKLTIAMKNVTAKTGVSFNSLSKNIAACENQKTKKGVDTGKAIISGINTGSATMKAVIDGQEYTSTITVTPPEITKKELKVKVGKKNTIALKKTKIKKNDIEWKSEDPTIATVESGGKITGIKEGTVVIYTETGGVRNECSVTVW